MAPATPDTEQLMSEYLELWNGDFSKLEVVSDSVSIYDPAAPDGEIHGRDAFEALLREIHNGFPDMNFTVDDRIASDEVVMYEWNGTGTHEGEFNDIPPTGREIDITGMSKTSIEDGKVQEDRIYFDTQGMFEQLGLTDD